MNNNKAPMPDGIPNVAVKAAIQTEPELFVNLFNQCLLEGIFPRSYIKLVLLLNPGKQPDNPFSYRPLCMLDTSCKILESRNFPQDFPTSSSALEEADPRWAPQTN